MPDRDDLSRRALLAGPAIFSLADTAYAQGTERPRKGGARTLIAYLSRSGNTRVIAETLQRALKAELFEIRTARPYPADYEQHVERATRERDSGFEPQLAGLVSSFSGFDTVFLGFPIWGGTAPAPIRSFLKAHDLRGKVLQPFITHGGFGVGGSPTVLTSHAAGARIKSPFVMEADQERRTLNEVRGWLGQI